MNATMHAELFSKYFNIKGDLKLSLDNTLYINSTIYQNQTTNKPSMGF
jgi:hypothetical protein